MNKTVMSEHTKGPWEYVKRQADPSIGQPAVIEVFRNHPSGFPDIICRYKANETGGMANLTSNAKLIASAPELLEACKAVMKHKRGEHLPAKVVFDLGQAINKAEGA